MGETCVNVQRSRVSVCFLCVCVSVCVPVCMYLSVSHSDATATRTCVCVCCLVCIARFGALDYDRAPRLEPRPKNILSIHEIAGAVVLGSWMLASSLGCWQYSPVLRSCRRLTIVQETTLRRI